MVQLYDFQQELLKNLTEKINKGRKRICCVSPTGSGKTVMIREFVRRLNEQYYTCFMLPSTMLVNQSIKAYNNIGLNFGKIYGQHGYTPEISNWISTVDTIISRHKSGKMKKGREKIDFFIIDEAHHARAAQCERLMRFLYPNAYFIGFTATPVRTDNLGLGAEIDGYRSFEDIIFTVSIEELINRGRQGRRDSLSPFEYYNIPSPDDKELTSALKNRNFKNIEQALQNDHYIGNCINDYRVYGWPQRKKNIIFASSVEHSKRLCYQFNKAGFPAAHLDADTKEPERRKIDADFRDGRILNLVSCNTISEGYDVPECSMIMQMRKTTSLSLWCQMSGRPIRYVPGKVALNFDYVGNLDHFGKRPDQITDTEWKEYFYGKKIERDVKTYTCPKPCYSSFDYTRHKNCPSCGRPHGLQPKTASGSSSKPVHDETKEVFFVDIDLKKVDKPEPAAKFLSTEDAYKKYYSEFHACKSMADFKKLLKSKGMKVKLATLFYNKTLTDKGKILNG